MSKPPGAGRRFHAATFAVILASTQAGCTVIPGLHVSLGDATVEKTRKISDHEEIRELAPNSGAIAALRIVTLTPQVILDAAQQRRPMSVPQLPTPATVRTGAEYRIGPGDVINVIVWEHPELTNPTGEFRDPISAGRLVDTEGLMYYPYIGSFKAAGMTVGELRGFVAQHLGAVISKPQVDARVVAFRSRRVQVSGEVRQPGLVSLDDTEKGIVDAIGERGGLTDNASRRRLELNRGGQRYTVSLAALLTGSQDQAPNPGLLPGDLLHVPDRSDDQVFVLGEVNKEGPVYLQQQRTTLTEVLANSGGLNRTTSNDAGVLVFRRPNADRVATVYRASLANAVGLLMAGEFALEPRDVVYVSSTSFSDYNSVINQLLPTISAIFQIDALVNR